MALRYSNTVANARLDVVETTVGTAPTMEIRTGAQPATADTAATGTVLATLALPSDWMAASSGRAKAKAGTWQDASADAAGNAGWFRITGAGGAIDGSVTATGGGGDLTVDNIVFAAAQAFSVTAFSLAHAN